NRAYYSWLPILTAAVAAADVRCPWYPPGAGFSGIQRRSPSPPCLEVACSGGDQEQREKVQDMARKDSIENLKKLLLKRRSALRQSLAGDLTMLSGLKEQTAGDVVDVALDSAQNELNSQLAEAESRELAQIENALEQVEAGRYGICERCDNPI